MSGITIGRIQGALCIKEENKNSKRVDINIDPITISVPDELLFPAVSTEKVEEIIYGLVMTRIKEISDKKSNKEEEKGSKMDDEIYFIKSDISCIVDNLNEISKKINKVSKGVKNNKQINPVIDILVQPEKAERIDNVIDNIKNKLEEIKSDIDEIEKHL